LKSASSRIIQKEFSEYLSTFYRKPVFWLSLYYVASTGGTPIDKIKQYIQSQDAPLCSKVGTFVLALKAFTRRNFGKKICCW
jgi:REP element-mobilizing transposase RayT